MNFEVGNTLKKNIMKKQLFLLITALLVQVANSQVTITDKTAVISLDNSSSSTNLTGINTASIFSETQAESDALFTQTTVLDGLDYPYALVLNGNELFVSDRDSGKISKIDITEATPTITDLVTDVSGILGMAINGNFLYYSVITNNKISKIDLTASTPTSTDVVTGLNQPLGLAFKGNELFIAEWGAGRISKIADISSTDPTVTAIVSGLNLPTKLAFKNNELYFSLDVDGKISKIEDVTASTLSVIDVVSGLTNPVGIAFKGNHLYITEPRSNTLSDRIFRTDVTQSSPVLEEILTLVNGPRGLVFNNDVLYFAEAYAGKVSKFDTSTLNLNQFNKNNVSMTIFPNPSGSTIQVTGLTQAEEYKIYNALGKQILEGSISSKENIKIEHLVRGFYFLKFNNRNILKFIKE